jgi:hypothetical protein
VSAASVRYGGAAPVIDNRRGVLGSQSVEVGMATPQPQAQGGEMDPAAVRGSPPTRSPPKRELAICGLPPCCSGELCASRDLRVARSGRG